MMAKDMKWTVGPAVPRTWETLTIILRSLPPSTFLHVVRLRRLVVTPHVTYPSPINPFGMSTPYQVSGCFTILLSSGCTVRVMLLRIVECT